MKYGYRCPICRTEVLSNVRADRLDQQCSRCLYGPLHRVFSFSYSLPFKEHFNAAAGTVVSSRTQHADLLKAQSEAETLKTGVEHKYVPVDPADAKAVYGIKDDVLAQVREDRAKHDLASGKTISEVSPTRTFVV